MNAQRSSQCIMSTMKIPKDLPSMKASVYEVVKDREIFTSWGNNNIKLDEEKFSTILKPVGYKD
jgi:hypothetical protein